MVEVSDGIHRVRRMPEVGEHMPAAGFDFGGLRVLVLVDHVLVGRLHVQAVRIIVHPGAYEGREVQARVAVKHGVVVHHLIGGLR